MTKQHSIEYVFLGLGGNLPQTMEAMHWIYDKCVSLDYIPLASSVYSSPAYGMAGPDFLNSVIRITAPTPVNPWEWLEKTKEWEIQLGRTQKSNNGQYQNRVIDIDLLDVGHRIIQGPGLSLPHPALHLRSFVLVPLLEIAPNWKHPMGFSSDSVDSSHVIQKVIDAKDWVVW